MTRVSSETKALHMAWQPLNDAGKKLDIMKHIHFKSQVGAQEGVLSEYSKFKSLTEKWLSQLSVYFQHLCSLSVLFPCFCPNQVLPTFHCKVKELLVLCEGLGGKGHSGAELWVVKLTGSEQDPFTELYIAYTLETVFKWVINVLTVPVAPPRYLTTKAPTTPSSNDRLFTDQWLALLHLYKNARKKKLQQKRNSVLCKYSHRPLSYLHYFFFPPVFPCLLPGFHTLW